MSLSTNASSILDNLLNEEINLSAMGIPETTYHSSDCMTSTEKTGLESYLNSSSLQINGQAARPSIQYCGSGQFIHPKFVKTIEAGSRYVNSSGSKYSCRKYRVSKAKAAILNQFKEEIIDFGDNLTSSSDAKCFFKLYKIMADEGSFLGDDATAQSRFIRLWTTGSLGALFIKNYNYVSSFGFFNYRKSGLEAIRNWFKKLGNKVRDDSISVRDSKTSSSTEIYEPTNMQISRSFALLASGIISNKPNHITESRIIFEEAMDHISWSGNSYDKGYLVAEMRRGRKAQSYHSISLATLLAIRALGKSTSCSFPFYRGNYNVAPNRIAFLFRKVAEGGKYKDTNGITQFRDNNIFPDKLEEMDYNGIIDLPSVEYTGPQVGVTNVDSLLALLPETATNSEDFEIKNTINTYLSSRGHVALQDNQPTDNTFQFKLGGNLNSYPSKNSIRASSDVFLLNNDLTDDYKALLQPGFCN